MLITACGPAATSTKTVTVANVFGDKFWKDTDRSLDPALGCPGRVMPLSYRMLDTDYDGLRKLLLKQGHVPGTVNLDTLQLSFPLPEGGWEPYVITQIQVLPPELADKYPGIKTYTGKSLTYPADNIRLDISPKGISAMILSTRGTIIMDPFCGFDTVHVITYYKKNLPGDMKPEFEK